MIYARVSRDDTGEGRSVERQVEACRKLADLRGWDVVSVRIDNSISAWSGKHRPAWDEVLGMVDAGEVDAIVAWQVDRMTRSMLDLEGLIALAEGKGVIIAAASGDLDLSNESGRMTARILAAVARQEVERKAARQRLANEARAKEGKPHSGGARPFGYADDYATVVEEEARAIQRGAGMVLAGMPLTAVAQDWIDAGLASSRSSKAKAPWTTRGVANVLSNPRYAGLRMYRGERVATAAWPAILDEETHLALVAKLGEPGRRKGKVKQGRRPTTLLTGLARCGVCGGPIRGSGDRRNGRLSYGCRGSFCLSLPRDPVDARVSGWIIALLSRPGILAELVRGDGDEELEAREAAASARARLADLEADFVAGGIDYTTYKRLRSALEAKVAEAETRMAQSAGGAALAAMVGVSDVTMRWLELPLDGQRALVEALAEVTLFPMGRKRSEWDPARDVKVALRNGARNDESPLP